MDIESDLAEIKKMLVDISRKLDDILEEREILGMMKLSEISLKEFLESEPDIYSIKDLKVRYRWLDMKNSSKSFVNLIFDIWSNFTKFTYYKAF